MKFPFFASFIVFCLWLGYQLKKSDKQADSEEKNFWNREAKANNTRRKSLEHLDYITIPTQILSMEFSPAGNISTDEDSPDSQPVSSRALECIETLRTLSTAKIVNFTGLTNTDLKLEYGAPNIKLLMEFDQNYTLLARTLQTLAEELFKAGFIAEAGIILEFAISTRTEVSQSYFLLADLYERNCQPEKIDELIQTAERLNTVMKNAIVRTLQGSGPYSGLLRSL